MSSEDGGKMMELVEILRDEFARDDEVSRLMNTGHLPVDLAEIAAEAMTLGQGAPIPAEYKFPSEVWMAPAQVIQRRFFGGAPVFGIMKALAGQGPATAPWIWLQIQTQLAFVADRRKQQTEA